MSVNVPPISAATRRPFLLEVWFKGKASEDVLASRAPVVGPAAWVLTNIKLCTIEPKNQN
jgi:hypothetical protein